jgi:hypothetical protein
MIKKKNKKENKNLNPLTRLTSPDRASYLTGEREIRLSD